MACECLHHCSGLLWLLGSFLASKLVEVAVYLTACAHAERQAGAAPLQAAFCLLRLGLDSHFPPTLPTSCDSNYTESAPEVQAIFYLQ